MDLSNLRLNRIAVHYIPQKSASGPSPDPEYGDDLIDLGPNALDILTQRVTEVMGDPSYSVEMEIRQDGQESTFQQSVPLIRAGEQDFLSASRHVADNLNDAQNRSNIPASVLLTAEGRVGEAQNNLVALIKAETQDGFSFDEVEGEVQVDFVRDLFLTRDQKLYKVGLLIESSEDSVGDDYRSADDFEVLVYDSNLRRSSDAAQYFYRTFLGCEYARSGKQLTKEFFNRHQKYFDRLDVDSEERKDLNTHLYSYLKSERDLIHTTEFADEYMPDERRASYLEFMEEHDVPERGIQKDLSLVESNLRNRQIRFANGVTLRAKADNFDEKVEVEEEEPESTRIRVFGEIEEQT